MARIESESARVKLVGVVEDCNLIRSEGGGDAISVMFVGVRTADASGRTSKTDYPLTVTDITEERRPYFEKLMELSSKPGKTEEDVRNLSVSLTGCLMENNGAMAIVALAKDVKPGDPQEAHRAVVAIDGEMKTVSRRETGATAYVHVDGTPFSVDFYPSAGSAWDSLQNQNVKSGHRVSVAGILQNDLTNSDTGYGRHFTIVGRKFEDRTLAKRQKTEERKAAGVKLH